MSQAIRRQKHQEGTRFNLSIAAVAVMVAVMAMMLASCCTSRNGTGTTPQAMSADVAGPCHPNGSKINPRICIGGDGSTNPPSGLIIHSKNNGKPNKVQFQTATGTGVLAITLNTCTQLVLMPGCGTGAICDAETVTTLSGNCSYTPTINSSTAADPIIVTDGCCPTTEERKPK